jgi:simple sugar transport system permease protein
MDRYAVPLLSDIPVVGPIFFHQLPLVYLVYVLGPIIAFFLFRTRHGLLVRSTGEMPMAVASAGVNVLRMQWVGVLTAGALAGLGGAFLSVGQLGLFAENMTAGRGFLALAAVVFGRWRPYGVLGACLVFGFTDALQLRLQSMETVPRVAWLALIVVGTGIAVLAAVRFRTLRGPLGWAAAASVLCIGAGLVGAVVAPRFQLPSQFWLCLPYVLSLVALAASSRNVHAPSMLGRPIESSLH